MTKNEFIIGDQYSYEGRSEPLTYLGESKSPEVGMFKSPLSGLYHNEYRNMELFTKPEPQYPNPPLPHCEERIAFAKGANIESSLTGENWCYTDTPQWNPNVKYRVKVEKTKDDLRIEKLEENIRAHENYIKEYKKELAKLKPTVHY